MRSFCEAFPPRLPDRGPHRRARTARSVFRQAVCLVLHDQARRRRRPGLRRHQGDEVLGELRLSATTDQAVHPAGAPFSFPGTHFSTIGTRSMLQRDQAWLRHHQMRWQRADAGRWIKPDAVRFVKPGVRPRDALPAFDSKFSPSQPRVPTGTSEGGQWTSGNSSGGTGGGFGGGGGIAFDGEGGGFGGDIGFDGEGIDLGGSLAFDSEASSDFESLFDNVRR